MLQGLEIGVVVVGIFVAGIEVVVVGIAVVFVVENSAAAATVAGIAW